MLEHHYTNTNTRKQTRKLYALAWLLSHVVFINAWAGEKTYVYTDKSGRTIMQDVLSDDARYYGYKIVNANGVVLQTVPGEKHAPAFESGIANNKTYGTGDWMLLQNYTRVEEIASAKQRRLSTIQSLIDSAESSLKIVEKNLADLHAHRAASSDPLLLAKVDKDIGDVSLNVQKYRKHLGQLRVEYKETSERYDADMKRFKTLQKSLSAKDAARQ